MIPFYLNQFLRESNSWLNEINQLVININTQNQRYNFYLQESSASLSELIQQIETYQNSLSNLLKKEPNENDYQRAEIVHNLLKEKYQNLKALSDSDFQLTRIFPLKESDWQVINQPDSNFEIFKGHEQTATVAKIKILADSNRTTALQAALIYAFQNINGLDYIDLSNNKLEDVAIQLLSNAFNGKYDHIQLNFCEALILSGNYISNIGLKTLLGALTNNPSSRHLLLNGNMIDFDIDFFNYEVMPKTQIARLVNLDLTMNFIPKGYMIYEDEIRIYYPKSRMKTKLSARSVKYEDRTTIKTAFLNHENCLRSLSATSSAAIYSLIASQDKINQEKEIDFQWGVIGLFANKTTFPFSGEHAYLVVEGISKFGQRYLVRGDLYTNDGNTVSIRVSQCSPEDFLKFTGKGERIYCRTGTFKREKIKAVLNKISEFHHEQSFHTYGIRPNPDGSTTNCIAWAVTILKSASDSISVDGWIPSTTVRHDRFCNIM